MRRHTTQIEGKICAVLAGSMHFVGQWVRLHMAITLLDVLDHIAQHHRCEFVPEAQREDVNVIAIEHIRWRLQSSKHVSESAGGWFFSIGPSVLIGLFFFKGGNFRPRLVRVLLVWNDMQWYSYSLPFLLMQTFWMDTHWMDPYWWDTCWRYVLVGYVLVGYVCDSCWCTPFEWIRIELIRMAWIRIGGIRVERIRIGGIRIGGIRIAKPADANLLNGYALHGYVLVGYVLNGYVLVGYVLVGYVLNGHVWDMCGVMDMCGICVVWDTPTIFWRTLRRNVFREK